MRRLVPTGIWEIFIPDLRRRRALQVRDPHARRRAAAEDRSVRAPFEAPPHDRLDRPRPIGSLRLARRRLDGATRGVERLARSADVDLRGAPRLVGARAGGGQPLPDLSRAGATGSCPTCKEMGFTHIELLPVMEHPFSRLVGLPGDRVLRADQPVRPARGFQVRSSTPATGTGIGVILDWVPGHFPKDAHGLARFDGTALYEHADPRQGEHQDWGTLIFNYGRNEVRNFLLSQRAVLARGVSHRRPARRRRRVDALSRLLARRRASGSRTSTAAARTSRRSRSCSS